MSCGAGEREVMEGTLTKRTLKWAGGPIRAPLPHVWPARQKVREGRDEGGDHLVLLLAAAYHLMECIKEMTVTQ